MKTTILIMLAACAAFAQTAVKSQTTLKDLVPATNANLAQTTVKFADTELSAKLKSTEQELRLVKLENLVRREEAAVAQVEQIRKDQQALFAETCTAVGVDPDPKVCAIDLNAKTVTKRAPAPATPLAPTK